MKKPPENFRCFAAVRIEVVDSHGQARSFSFRPSWGVWALCRFLDLRRSDVERGTGVRAEKLCRAETKRANLNRPETGSLRAFLLQRLEATADQQEAALTVCEPSSDLVN